MTEMIERTTACRIEPEITMFELAGALLDNSQFLSCAQSTERMVIKNGKKQEFGLPGGVWKALQPHLKKQSIVDGLVSLEKVTNFSNSHARYKIIRKFGFADFNIVGTPRHITGVRITNVVANDATSKEQIIKYATFVRSLRRKLPTRKIKYEGCFVMAACNTEVAKLLQELIERPTSKQGEEA
jgi:hypothetical protein